MKTNQTIDTMELYISSLLKNKDITSDECWVTDKSLIITDKKTSIDASGGVSKKEKALRYLSFGLHSRTYIVPATDVITVRYGKRTNFPADLIIYDPGNIISDDKNYKLGEYFLHLKSTADYIIRVNSINGIIELTDDKLKYISHNNTRPWYRGISCDHLYLLLDSYVLGDVLVKRQFNEEMA